VIASAAPRVRGVVLVFTFTMFDIADFVSAIPNQVKKVSDLR